MMDQLDELRIRLGIVPGAVSDDAAGRTGTPSASPPVSSSSQENLPGNGVEVGMMVGSSADLFSARQVAHQREMERLQAGGDDSDGLEAVRLAFRRMGR